MKVLIVLCFLVQSLIVQAQGFTTLGILMGDKTSVYETLTTTDTTCIIYLKFDEGSGDTVIDYSPNIVNNGAGTVGDPSWGTGKKDGCLVLSGSGQYADIPYNTSVRLTDNFTISIWVKYVTGVTQGICGRLTTAVGDAGYVIGIKAGSIVDFPDWDTGASSDGALSTEWTHIVAIQDAGTNKLYINGVLQADTDTRTVEDYDAGDFTIGRIYNTTENFYFNGSVDELLVFKRVLTQEEILALYNL